ncbi:MAG: hypothetical protein GX129_13105 [Clostridiales bacterium]|jgi:hypothetical protein|nr:hypothetical protein [Clostridiales bacterium]
MSDSSRNNKMDPRKLVILMELMKEAEGKSMDKLLPLIINTNKKLKEQNLAFTKDESDLMIEVLTRNMSPRDKAQFEMLRTMMGNRK